MQKQAERRSGGTWLWQAFTGALVVILLGLHMIVQHFVASGGLRTYQEVLDWFRTPVVWIIEVIFLLVVTYHALLGVRAVVADLHLGRRATDAINVILTIAGVIAILYGFYLTYALLAKA